MNELKGRLQEKARCLRRHVVRMIAQAGSGHPGGCLSAADIMAVLFFHWLRLDSKRPDWPERDRFILSKGHAAPVLYAALAERGFFPRANLEHLRKLGSPLQGHPDMHRLPGVEMSTGSLGQGLSIANGLALAGRLDEVDYRVCVLLGDGELEEGQVWEAAMAAAHYRLGNLIAFVDYNGLQIDGAINEVLSPVPLKAKWEAFGWQVQEIDGHDINSIINALQAAEQVKDLPVVIIARTVKGKGVSFMEDQVNWHGKAPKIEEMEKALAELGEEGASYE